MKTSMISRRERVCIVAISWGLKKESYEYVKLAEDYLCIMHIDSISLLCIILYLQNVNFHGLCYRYFDK